MTTNIYLKKYLFSEKLSPFEPISQYIHQCQLFFQSLCQFDRPTMKSHCYIFVLICHCISLTNHSFFFKKLSAHASFLIKLLIFPSILIRVYFMLSIQFSFLSLTHVVKLVQSHHFFLILWFFCAPNFLFTQAHCQSFPFYCFML